MARGNVSKEYYLFFRRSCLDQQRQIQGILDLTSMPRVFLHGNPHVDNFAKTEHGEAMIDFDRSRIGPYCWDVIRFFCSLSLRRKEVRDEFLPKAVVRAFADGYALAFEHPEREIRVPRILKSKKPDPEECSMRSYLDANLRWAKRMRKNPLFASDPAVVSLMQLYFRGRYENDALERYRIDEAGLASGSLGKPRVLVVLSDLASPQEDPLLLDIKEVYQDPDDALFFNPYVHHGLRMIEASHLHAPGMERMMSFLTWRGQQYWGRRVPCFKAKIKGNLPEEGMEKLAYAVAVQLGRAHRRSLREMPTKRFLAHFKLNLDSFIEAGAELNDWLDRVWRANGKRATLETQSIRASGAGPGSARLSRIPRAEA